nr:xylulose kinase-1 [Tanacetum cinerariifolium]
MLVVQEVGEGDADEVHVKDGEYDIWAMKMQNFISSSDLLCWNIVLKGNSSKSMTTDNDGNLKIRPPVTAEEHQQVQKEEKARIILLFALPYEHMGDFYHMIDARDIWNAIKARFGLEYISFDDLYNKLKFLKIDTKGYSSSSSTLSNAAFVSTAGSSQCNLSYLELGNGGYTTTISASPGSSSSRGSLKSKCSVVDDVIYYFFPNHEIDQHLVYEDLDQMNKEEFEEYDLKHQMAMLSIKQMGHFLRECQAQGGQNSNNYQKYKSKETGKDGSDSKAMVVVDGSIDWDKQTEEGNIEPRSLEKFGMIARIKIKSDVDSEGEVVFANDAIPAGVSVFAGNVAAAVSPQSKTEFALMGLSTEANLVSDGETTLACNSIPLSVSVGDVILGPRPLNIQPKSWSWKKYGVSKTKGSKINGGSKSMSWSFAKGLLGRLKLEKAKDRGIVDSGCLRSMSGNKDKLEDFEDFNGGEVTFGGST